VLRTGRFLANARKRSNVAKMMMIPATPRKQMICRGGGRGPDPRNRRDDQAEDESRGPMRQDCRQDKARADAITSGPRFVIEARRPTIAAAMETRRDCLV